MKTKYIIQLAIVLFFSQGILQSVSAQASIKKRIAVFEFENKTNNRYNIYGSQHIGQEVSDMITTELVKSGNFKVIERQQLDALIREQDLGTSGIITTQSAAEAGKVLGVELAVFGAVTEMGHSKGNKGLKIKGVNVGMGKASAVVAIDIRIVNTTTGEIVAAENIRKTKSGIAASASYKNYRFNDRNQFDSSLTGKATRGAVDEIIELLANSAEEIAWSAKVITMKNGKVYINSGKQDGVQVGSSLIVFRPGEALIDPDTGLNLGSVDEEIGMITVIDNSVGEGKASICSVVKGEEFDKGDIVKIQ